MSNDITLNFKKQLLGKHKRAIALSLTLVILFLFPWIVGEKGQFYIVLLMTVFIFATLGHAWNLLAGFCGLLSFGTQVYVGLAGFTVAILVYYFGVPPYWSLSVAALVTAAFAWLLAVPISDVKSNRNIWTGTVLAVALWILYEIAIYFNQAADIFGGDYIRRVVLLLLIFLGALPLLKLQGAYFSVATWLIAAAVASVFNEWRVVGAGGGMNIPSDTTVAGRYYAALLLVIAATAVVWWLLESRYGKALTAVRDDEEAARSIGINVRRVKTLVFVISAPMAGLAAGLFYIDAVTITPADAFHIRWSAYAVFIVVAGGMGTLWGPIIGAVLFVIVQRFLVGYWGGGELTLGIAAILLILILPRGVAGLISDLQASKQLFKDTRKKEENVSYTLPVKLSHPLPGVVSAFLVPSNPLPYLCSSNPPWRPLIDAYQKARAILVQSSPDILLIYSSSWIAVLDQPFQMHPRVKGVHVDENWHEFGELLYDLSIDQKATEAIIRSCHKSGVRGKGVDYEQFPIDSGTIVTNQFLNHGSKYPAVIAAANIYHDYQQTKKIAIHATETAKSLGYRIAVIGIGGLSGSLFRHEMNIERDTFYSEADDQWNRRVLEMIKRGDIHTLQAILPQFIKEAQVENGFKQLAWLTGAMNDKWKGAQILGYTPIYGSGAAILSFDLE